MGVTRAGLLVIASLLAGCGLVLDLDPEPDAAGLDAGMRRDGSPTLDAARVDGEVTDAGDCDPDDRDGDGFSECEGDCDETDDAVYPGAPLLCGDGVVNDCPTYAGEDFECQGIFVATDGDDDGDGTWADPFATIGRGALEANERNGATVYVAVGEYDESVVLLGSDVVLRGGLDRDTWRPTDDVTRLELEGNTGLRAVDDATGVAVRDMEIASVAGDSSVSTVSVGPGAELEVSLCTIEASARSTFARAISADGVIGRRSSLLVRGSEVIGGSFGQEAFGIDVNATTLEVRGTVVRTQGRVGMRDIAVSAREGSVVDIERLVVAPERGEGSSVFVHALDLDGSSGVIRRSVLVTSSCLSDCSAARIVDSAGPVRLENSLLLSRGTDDGGPSSALFIKLDLTGNPTASAPELQVTSNVILGSPPDGGLAHGVTLDAVGNLTGVEMGSFSNNIIWSGASPGSRAFVEVSAYGVRPVALTHNALYNQDGTRTVYQQAGGASAQITFQSLVSWAANNIPDDCGIDPFGSPADFELPSTSACIDAGAEQPDVLDDYDEDGVRPVGDGWDIGAQELARE